ncbi:MAG: primosomal protein N' [bacterium]
MTARRFCDIVVPRTRLDELTYECGELPEPLAVGDCVEVRLRQRKVRGLVVGFPASSKVSGVKPVERLVERELLGPDLLRLADWVSGYHCCPRGEALALVLPRGVAGRQRRGEPGPGSMDAVRPVGESPGFGVEVDTGRAGRLELVTGFLEGALRRGGAILLLPEGQLGGWLSELRCRFGEALAEYHSRLGLTALKRTWREIRGGRRRLVVGVCSAVFAPLGTLAGIAVVDAHDPVFKVERYPRYNARDVAVVRARMAGCPVLLSDPLPAAETWHSVSTGQYRLRGSLPEPRRYPASYIVDMRRSRERVFSARLRRELEQLPAGASAVLYVNRKGLSRHVACVECGSALECPDCRLPVSLTAGRLLSCAWCGNSRPAPEACPVCGGTAFDLRAAGVELVARELGRMFPEREVVKVESSRFRPDREGETGRGSRFPAGALAVGTRTLLGLVWPNPVGLVAAVNFDYELSVPEYHVRERAFAALATLVTRAESAGAKLVVQTRRPDEPVIDAGLSRDVAGFMAGELGLRQEAGLPPWQRLAVIEVGDGNRGAVLTQAGRIARALSGRRGVEVVGPAEAPGQRVRLLVRFPRGRSLGTLLDRSLLRQGHLRVRVDVDPKDTG